MFGREIRTCENCRCQLTDENSVEGQQLCIECKVMQAVLEEERQIEAMSR